MKMKSQKRKPRARRPEGKKTRRQERRLKQTESTESTSRKAEACGEPRSKVTLQANKQQRRHEPKTKTEDREQRTKAASRK
jgi:hypothetical protein